MACYVQRQMCGMIMFCFIAYFTSLVSLFSMYEIFPLLCRVFTSDIQNKTDIKFFYNLNRNNNDVKLM